jgi:hypothetical protein
LHESLRGPPLPPWSRDGAAAWRRIDEALTFVEATKDRWCEAEINRTAGLVALMPGEPSAEKAETYFERALAVARQQQAKSCELRAATSLARLWRDQGRYHAEFDFRMNTRAKLGIDDVKREGLAIRGAHGKGLTYQTTGAG